MLATTVYPASSALPASISSLSSYLLASPCAPPPALSSYQSALSSPTQAAFFLRRHRRLLAVVRVPHLGELVVVDGLALDQLVGWRFPALPGVRFLVLVAVKIGTWRFRL